MKQNTFLIGTRGKTDIFSAWSRAEKSDKPVGNGRGDDNTCTRIIDNNRTAFQYEEGNEREGHLFGSAFRISSV